jgi:predicted nucleic acid-binding protein
MEFVDTNIVIYAHDSSAGEKRRTSESLIERLTLGGAGALSTQILVEFYAAATRKFGLRKEDAAAIIADFGSWTVHRLGHADLLAATLLRSRHKVSWWDALVLQSAQALGCEILWTEDLAHGHRYGSVTVRSPFR